MSPNLRKLSVNCFSFIDKIDKGFLFLIFLPLWNIQASGLTTLSVLKVTIRLTYTEIQIGNFCYGLVIVLVAGLMDLKKWFW